MHATEDAERMASAIQDFARTRFGFDRLRPGQQEAIEALLGGRDALVVMPTGSGKVVLFGDVGYETRSVGLVRERALLTAV